MLTLSFPRSGWATLCVAAISLSGDFSMVLVVAAEPPGIVAEAFDHDPKWDGYRNELLPNSLPRVRQAFGHRPTNLAGGDQAGEIGGIIQRAHQRAYFAKPIAKATLEDPLSASGKFAVTKASGGSGLMFGWFNDELSHGWRTPCSLAFRIDGNGDKYWLFYEYGTKDWGTGGGGAFDGPAYQTTRTPPFPADGTVHDWSLKYDPDGADGNGLVTFRVDDREYQLPLQPGHKQQGAVFDRFGILSQQSAGDSMEVYFDDVKLQEELIAFDDAADWLAEANEVSYQPHVVRPYHNFGFRDTNIAGGKPGEIGGIVFRDEQPMYYASEVGPFTLNDELFASGNIALKSAAADSGVALGWFSGDAKRAKTTPEHEQRQTDYLGVMIEGPSRIGHFFRAAYSTSQGEGDAPSMEGTPDERPLIRPDSTVHRWSIHYEPAAAQGRGRITVTFDGKKHELDLRDGHKSQGATLDRFGVFDWQSGGHHIEFFLDELRYSKSSRSTAKNAKNAKKGTE